MEENNEIRVLDIVTAIRTRPGMYIGGVTNADILAKELWDNCADESIACSYCNKIFIYENFNGYLTVGDSGRGISICMSKDKPGETACSTAVSYAHSGSKFSDTSLARSGQNGIGLTACNSVSYEFIVLSKVTQDNYNKSLPIVEETWNKYGPRSKKDIFYIIAYRRGQKFFEGCDKLENIEQMIFGSNNQQYEQLPRGFSTIVLLKPDPEIFESISCKVPIKNIQYFLLIQEKLYKRKIEVAVNGQLVNGTFQPYKFEMFKTIIPKDTSKNASVSVYVTFEVDPELGQKQEYGSVSGLSVDRGVHIQYIESCYEEALKNEFKIKHKYIQNGLKICVIAIASDVIYSSQTKEILKSISKVKLSDFGDVVKEFQKIFRNNPDYWNEHVAKLNYLAESMRSLSAEEKAQKMIESSTGNSMYRRKSEMVPGYAPATAGASERFNCELWLCEGQSAAGSLINGRKSTLYTGVVGLRGKVLNTSESDIDKVLANKEFYTIFSLMGLGIGIKNVTDGCKSSEEAYEKIKKYAQYGKLVICTDEDSDGSQIRAGILYCISKFARFMIDFGLVYYAQGPLFKQNGKFFYQSDIMPGNIFPNGLDPSKHFLRFKGIGSIDVEDVAECYFNPGTRRIVQVTPDNINYAMSLTEDINVRKKLLFEAGIISNPYGFTDL